VYPRLRLLGKGFTISIPDIYIKIIYETLTRKGKPITRQQYLPITAIASTYEKQAAQDSIVLPEEECPATFKDANLLISNRADSPEEAALAYVRRCFQVLLINFGHIFFGHEVMELEIS